VDIEKILKRPKKKKKETIINNIEKVIYREEIVKYNYDRRE